MIAEEAGGKEAKEAERELEGQIRKFVGLWQTNSAPGVLVDCCKIEKNKFLVVGKCVDCIELRRYYLNNGGRQVCLKKKLFGKCGD
jgi:hypothetical protein